MRDMPGRITGDGGDDMTPRARTYRPRFRLRCRVWTSHPFVSQADAERRLDGIDRVGACDLPHVVEVSRDGGVTWEEIPTQADGRYVPIFEA